MTTVGSLFSGIGGFDRGLELAGWEVQWQVENDKFCNQILERHWPGVTRYGDITAVNTDQLSPVDLLCGGFPCQDLSVAGRREGLAGERSSLFFEFARIAGALTPRWLLVENVPGLFSSSDGRDFGIVISTLAELGYGLAWRVLDSQYFGVAQRRRRVFIVGHLGKPCPPEILFESESLRGNSPPSRQAGTQPAYSPKGGSGERGWPVEFEAGLAWGDDVSRPLLSKANSSHDDSLETYTIHNGQGDPNWDRNRAFALDTQQPSAVAFAQNQRGELRTSDISPQLTTGGGKPGEGYPAVAFNWQSGGDVRLGVSEERTDALHAGQVPAVGPPPDPGGVREATGVPRRVDTPDSPRYRALGNAVTVPVAEWIGRRILSAHQEAIRYATNGIPAP